MNNNTSAKRCKKTLIQPTLYHTRRDSKKQAYCYSNSRYERKNGITKNRGNFFLSALFPCQFTYNDITFKSVMHYLQCQKFNGGDEHSIAYKKLILSTDEPMDAFYLGQQKCLSGSKPRKELLNTLILANAGRVKRDPQWNKKREAHFVHATYCKFDQNQKLREALLSTHPYHIVEESKDLNWGDGVNSCTGHLDGKNRGGNLLMYVRLGLLHKYPEDPIVTK